MEVELVNGNHLPGVLHRLLPAFGPALLISITYVDPGKWAATVEGGARFGHDLVVLMLIFNVVAILCQYLSACISVVTGKDLAQICSDEYDKFTCMFLGVQATVSMIVLDLTMILGIAHGLNLLFGVDLSMGVFLTALDAVLSPFFSTLLERWKAKFLLTWVAGLVLPFYILGVLDSQPEIPLSMNGMLTKLSEDSVFTLMSLLGASIMPHNFYLHSSVVLQHQGLHNVSKSALCHNHFWVIFCIFSGIYLVNYVLMNSAAKVFYSTGLVLLTFPDALSLMEQTFRSPAAPLTFLLILYLTSQITSLTWNLGGQVVLHEFLRLDIPNWLQRATIRIIAIIPALYCIWTAGVEGVYQLLIFTQVMVALLLPSSVIPLFRVASSRQIMNAHKISQLVEFLALITFLGMLGLKVIFLVEMIFGDSDWVGNLRGNMGTSLSMPYLVLLVTACSSFCLMLWLAATPLKSATHLDAQAWNWDSQDAIPEPSAHRGDIFLGETRYTGKEPVQKPEPGKSIESYPDLTVAKPDLDLPETILESDEEPLLTNIEENHSDGTFPSSSVSYPEDPASTKEYVAVSTAVKEVVDGDFVDAKKIKIKSIDMVEKNLAVEGDMHTEKEDKLDAWEPEESSNVFGGSASSLTSDGPGSLRSLSGKSDEGGNGAGSLSRLAGLGRAARRQFAVTLDKFWGQIYDFHGQATPDAKAKKLDVLLSDPKLASFLLKVHNSGKESSGYAATMGSRGSDSMVNSGLCDSTGQLRVQNNIDPLYGVPRGSSSLWFNNKHLLDAYVQGSSCNFLDSTERRYSSMRTLSSSGGWDNQPATVHGYQIASIVDRIAKDMSSNSLSGHLEPQAPISPSPSLGPGNHRDPYSFALTQKLQKGLSSSKPPGFESITPSRNSPLNSESPSYDICASGYNDNGSMSANTKKYHSLPDISGLSGPLRNLYTSENVTQWNTSVGFGPFVGREIYEQSMYSNIGPGVGVRSVANDLSRSYGDSLSYNAATKNGSIWSKQPFEQFGVADKSHAAGSAGDTGSYSITREGISLVNLEDQLLRSFRHCIVELLKLEGSNWLFRQNDGADEDLIDRVAGREMRDSNLNPLAALRNDEAGVINMPDYSVPHCGEECVWKVDLIVSFGVWCIHRILDLSRMESRPEFWGKYTYVLNRLQVCSFNCSL
uniref:Ethylene insensitive protein n=1 Tax=Rhizophora mucronata TaxID=61149 RepID=A0A2P2MC59_RHIMU